MILILFLVFEIISVFIYGTMFMQDCFADIIPNYSQDDKSFILGIIAICAGWIFVPYFVFLAIKYFVRKSH